MPSIGDNYLRTTRLCGDAYTKEPLGVGKRFSHRAHGKPRSFAGGHRGAQVERETRRCCACRASGLPMFVRAKMPRCQEGTPDRDLAQHLGCLAPWRESEGGFAAGSTSLRRAGFALRPQRRREEKGKVQRGCPLPKALSRIATAPPAGPIDEGCGFAAGVTSLRPLPLGDLCVNPFFLFFRVLLERASPPVTLRRPGGSGACGDLPRALTPCVRPSPAAAARQQSAASPSGAFRRRAPRSGGCVRG